MKTVMIALAFLVSSSVYSQKKPLPTQCPGLEQTLQLIKKNFSNLARFKKSPIPGKTDKFLSSISICGVIGELSIYKDAAELTFKFTQDRFSDEKDKLLPQLVANLRKAVKNVWGTAYEETTEKESDEYWGDYQTITFHPYTGYYPHIQIYYPFTDDFCWIRFEYGK